MKRTPFAARTKPMPPSSVPMSRYIGLRTGAPLSGTVKNAATGKAGTLERRTRLRPRSAKTAARYVTRRAIVAELFAEPSICEVPWCSNVATDPHEPLTRARGGDILDRSNIRKVCNPHNVLFASDEQPWMYQLGFLKHSGLCCRDRDICEQYTQEAS